MNHDYRIAREKMVKKQLILHGITDQGVLNAMRKVPRHLFVEEALVGEAYNDHPLPIGHQQTISQPYLVALMTQALELTGKGKTLELGTGCGYQTAILAELSEKVYTIERIRPLMEEARALLAGLNYLNVIFSAFDGTTGWKEYEPYNAIMVTAGAARIPQPLLEQLADGGRMIIPIGDKTSQKLIKITRDKYHYDKKILGECRFVDLIGIHGWNE